MHTCNQCGTTFEGRKRKYCTKKCSSKASRNSTKPCTTDGCAKPVRAKGLCATHYNQTKPDRHRKHDTACEWCGTVVQKQRATTRRAVCSDRCKANLTRPPKCDLPQDHWALWFGKTSQWPRLPIQQCEWCNKDFAPKSKTHSYCGNQCSTQAANLVRRRKRGGLTLDEWEALDRICSNCGGTFNSPHSGDMYCTPRCQRLAALLRGRRGAGGGWITRTRRIAIYERDAYMCHICNEPTEPDAEPLTDWFPSLDHRIPVSKGGTNADENLATAHRYCNAVRQDGDPDVWGLTA